VFKHVEASVLLEGLRSTATHNDTQNRTLAACCRKFALFVQTFAPYFNVLSICTHVRTEWSGCFWGVVGLLFQVSTLRYTTISPISVLTMSQEASDNLLFLEKIANTLEAMASVLPPYHQIYAICKRRIGNVQDIVEDENLATLMSHVYLDIVTILLDMYRVFGRTTQGTSRGSHMLHKSRQEYQSELWFRAKSNQESFIRCSRPPVALRITTFGYDRLPHHSRIILLTIYRGYIAAFD
jgi:hypothetical protein